MNFLQGFQNYSSMFQAQPMAPQQGMDPMMASADTSATTTTSSAPLSCSMIQDTYSGSTDSGSQSGSFGCCRMTSNNLLDWGTGGGEGVVA